MILNFFNRCENIRQTIHALPKNFIEKTKVTIKTKNTTIFLLSVGLFCMNSIAQTSQSLMPEQISHTVTCNNPNINICVIKKPITGYYKYLSLDIGLEDRGTYWLADFSKSNKKQNDTQEIKIVSETGTVYSINVKFTVTASSGELNKPVAPKNEKSNQSKSNFIDEKTENKSIKAAAADVVNFQKSKETSDKNKSSDTSVNEGKESSLKSNSPVAKDLLPCIQEACIGDSIESIKVELLQVTSLEYKLSNNINLNDIPKEKNITKKELDDVVTTAIKMLKNGKVSEFSKFTNDFSTKMGNPSGNQFKSNAEWIARTESTLRRLLKNSKSTPFELLNYLSPSDSPSQPSIDINQFIEANRNFDSNFNKAFKPANLKPCYPYVLTGFFNSKSGHLTAIRAKPDIDGVYKISSIQRIIPAADKIARSNLRKEISEKYSEFSHKDPMASSLVSIDGFSEFSRSERFHRDKTEVLFQLVHPMEVKRNGTYDADNFERWTKGWLSLKRKDKFVSLIDTFRVQEHCLAPKISME